MSWLMVASRELWCPESAFRAPAFRRGWDRRVPDQATPSGRTIKFDGFAAYPARGVLRSRTRDQLVATRGQGEQSVKPTYCTRSPNEAIQPTSRRTTMHATNTRAVAGELPSARPDFAAIKTKQQATW